MPDRAYLSNLNSAWPIERQEALLAERVPDWERVARYQDVLKPKQRQSHHPALLTERAAMLRPTSRSAGERIYVASLSVLAWAGDDFGDVMSALAKRGATVIALAEGVEVDPGDLAAAGEVFRRSRKRAAVEARQRAGVVISAANRKAASAAKVALVKAYWELPSDQWPRREIERISGLSWNTLRAHLGRRDVAQRRYEARMKRKAREKK